MPNNFLKEYFTYSRRERNGIIILIAIMLILVIAGIIVPRVIDIKHYNYSEYETELLDFENSVKSEVINEKNDDKETVPFMFNPNTIDESGLSGLGLDRRVINNIIKYRKSGGYFRRKRDFLKIYGMDTSLYKRLAPFIYLETEVLKKLPGEKSRNNNTAEGHGLININVADMSLLTDSLGINRELSERIIKYRYLLGGFSDKDQFYEIYGITTEQSVYLAANVFIDTAIIRRININNANEQVLSRHPYLNNYYARAIVRYRKFSGEVKNVNELSTNNILPENIYSRISSYLSVN